MAWTSGTATDYRDLLRRLRQFLTADMTPAAERWQQMRWDEQPQTQELILKGPGLSGADEIYIGILSYENAAQGWYWWDLQGFTGYVAANPFNGQPGAIADNPAGISLHQYAIPYWFIANGRRVIVIAKVGTRYEQAYLGFMLPYATPSEHFYPIFIGGSLTQQGGRDGSRTDDGHRAFWHPRWYGSDLQNSASLLWMAGAWRRVANRTNGQPGTMMYPYCMRGITGFGQTPAGHYALIPVQPLNLSSEMDNRHSFGALDGVFYVSGMNNASENIITVAGKQYLCVQNIFRTAWHEFASFALE